jgi:para-aminobenzoate synthetase
MANFYRMAKEFHLASNRRYSIPERTSKTQPEGVPGPAPKTSEVNPLQMFVRRSSTRLTAEQLFERAFVNKSYAFWLDSSLTRDPDARFSFLGGYSTGEAECIRYYAHNRRLTIQDGGVQELTNEDLFPYLKKRLAGMRVVGPKLPFDFDGGFIGYFGYELKVICGARSAHRTSLPDACAILATRFVALDHFSGEVYLVFIGEPDTECEASAWFQCVEDDFASGQLPDVSESHDRGDGIRFEPVQSEGEYLENIKNSLHDI